MISKSWFLFFFRLFVRCFMCFWPYPHLFFLSNTPRNKWRACWMRETLLAPRWASALRSCNLCSLQRGSFHWSWHIKHIKLFMWLFLDCFVFLFSVLCVPFEAAFRFRYDVFFICVPICLFLLLFYSLSCMIRIGTSSSTTTNRRRRMLLCYFIVVCLYLWSYVFGL